MDVAVVAIKHIATPVKFKVFASASKLSHARGAVLQAFCINANLRSQFFECFCFPINHIQPTFAQTRIGHCGGRHQGSDGVIGSECGVKHNPSWHCATCGLVVGKHGLLKLGIRTRFVQEAFALCVDHHAARQRTLNKHGSELFFFGHHHGGHAPRVRHEVKLGTRISTGTNGIASVGARRCGSPSLVGGLWQILFAHGLIALETTRAQNDSVLGQETLFLAILEYHHASHAAVVSDEGMKLRL